MHEENLENVPCVICSKSFKNIEILKKHIKKVHDETKRNHSCSTCEKAFKDQKTLKLHIKMVHEGVKNHECETCGNSLFPIEISRKTDKILF